MTASTLTMNRLRVGQVLRGFGLGATARAAGALHPDAHWLVLSRELGAGHDYGLPVDHSVRAGVRLRYIDPELGLGDVLQPHQRRRVVQRSLVPVAEQTDLEARYLTTVTDVPWEVEEQATWNSRTARLIGYELLAGVPCPVAREVMLERAVRLRLAADVLDGLNEAIVSAEIELSELGEQLPVRELMIVDQDFRRHPEPDLKNLQPLSESVGAHYQDHRFRAADLRREAAQLEEWRRVRLTHGVAADEVSREEDGRRG